MIENKYSKILKRVRKMAQDSEKVEAVYIIGSYASTVEKADEYSDLDFVMVTNDLEHFITRREWIEKLGTPLCVFHDDHPGWITHDMRILFDDFLETDFVLFEHKQLETEWIARFAASTFASGYEPVIDRKNIISLLLPYMNKDPETVPDDRILNEINDYFFHCNWIKKKIDRGALFVAHSCLNTYMKTKLLFIIEALEKEIHGPDYNTWFEGRYIEKWAGPAIIDRLETCFSGYSKKEILRALKSGIALYRDLAEELCLKRAIDFPGEMVNRILLHVVDGQPELLVDR